MSALPRPDLPPGPQRELVDALHDLHHRAGWPSLRALSRAAACSHTTVSTVFSSPRLPAWGLLELLVEAMDGSVPEFRKLWLAATGEQPRAPAAARLAGRQSELSAVLRHLDSGVGVLLVAGEAGIGKTRLVDTATTLTDTFVAHSNCLPLAGDVPLLPVADALQEVAAEDGGSWLRAVLADTPAYVRAELGRLIPEVAPSTNEEPGNEWSRQRLFLAVGTTMAALRTERPWALLIEDLHWADAGTLDLLEHLLAGGPVIPVLGTWRMDDPDTSPRSTEWWTRVRRSPAVRVLELGPMTRDETAAQLELIAGGPRADADVNRIHLRSQGLPLFTEQLAADDGPSTRLPRLLSDLLDQRLQGLSPAGWHVAGVLGAADRDLAAPVLRDASGLEPDALGRGLRELADRHLLASTAEGRIGLRHPLLAEAVRRRLLGPEATDVHRRVAHALAAAGNPAAEIAEHWQRAGDANNELDWRISAALEAGARFAPRTEWRHWRRAFELWTEETRSRGAGSRLTLPEALVRGYDAAYADGDLVGQTNVVERLLSITDAAPSIPLDVRAAALRRAGDHLATVREARPALELISEAADIYRDLPPCIEYVQTLENQANVLIGLGEIQAAVVAAQQAVDIAERTGDRQCWRHAVAELAWYEAILGHHESARAHMAQALDEVDPEGVPFPELGIGVTLTDLLLIQQAPPEAFERAGRPGLETAERWNLDTFGTNLLRSNIALGYLMGGLVDRAVAVLGPVPDEVTVDEAPRQFVQACLDTVQGRLEVAAGRLEVLVRLPGDLPPTLEGAAAEARLELWRGEPANGCSRFGTVLADVTVDETSAFAGAHLLLLARIKADVSSIEGYDRAARSESAANLRALRRQAAVDPLGEQLTPEVRTAFHRTWEAELARLEERESTEAWAAAATAWDPMVRPHDAAYCRWRGAQVALARGQGTIAARLLKRAASDAREHVPLASAIAETSRGG